MAKSKMNAAQMVAKLNDLDEKMWDLRNQGVPDDDDRIVRLQAEWDRIDALEPSDSVTLTDKELRDLDDLIIM